MRSRAIVAIAILSAAVGGRDAAAQSSTYGAGSSVARAATASAPPTIDGEVLDDPAWASAPVISDFTQTTPDEGESASERTEVRVMYTPDMLYVGVVAYDREPAKLIVSDSRRDAALDNMDSFRFILDTYRDRQNGFIFGTNPAGIEYDAQVSNEGQGGGFGGGPRARAGSGGGLNVNWDASWTVEARTGDYGWSAEFAIPFRTLRFNSGAGQIWGANFERTIRRKNETAYWAPLPRQYGLPRVSLAGSLEGISVQSPRNLQFVLYVLGEGGREAVSSEYSTVGPEFDFGADLKYSITPSLTLDATYNTDFAQVEVDEQQINLDRFNLFFPEKRPFFLENAGHFAAGQPGEVELFFSRQIGIGPKGQAVPIVAGARLSGDAGGMKVGLLNMQTAQVGRVSIPGNNFGVARIKRELPNRSFVGGLFTNRRGVGDFAAGDDYNRVFAVDGQYGIGRYGMVSGFAARSFTPGISGDEYAFHLRTGYDAESWLLETGYTEVSEGFNPEVGFLRRSSYRKVSGLVFRRFRPEFLGFHELRPHVSYNGYWGLDGFHESGFLHVDNHWEWANGYEIHTGINFTHEGVREPFTILGDVAVAAGSFNHREAMIVGNTDRTEWISMSMRMVIGGFFGGERVALTPALSIRSGEAFNSEFSLSRNMIDLPGGSFTTNLIRARLSYSFTPRLYVQSLVQYNDAADLWAANLRVGWLHTAGTGLFIVFNRTSGFDDLLTPGLDNQSLIIKYSRLFNVLN